MFTQDTPPFRFLCKGKHGPMVLTDSTVTLHVTTPDKSTFSKVCVVEPENPGYVHTRMYVGDLAKPGTYIGQLEIEFQDDRRFSSDVFAFTVKERIYDR